MGWVSSRHLPLLIYNIYVLLSYQQLFWTNVTLLNKSMTKGRLSFSAWFKYSLSVLYFYFFLTISWWIWLTAILGEAATKDTSQTYDRSKFEILTFSYFLFSNFFFVCSGIEKAFELCRSIVFPFFKSTYCSSLL
jgi:hypothetical protein